MHPANAFAATLGTHGQKGRKMVKLTKGQLEAVLWVAFTALFFVIFCSISYVMSGSLDMPTAILFFVLVGLVDKKGIGYLVEYYSEKYEEKTKNSSQ